MNPSDYRQVHSLMQRIEEHPTKYGAWEAALQLARIDIAPFYKEIREGLKSSDPFSRECFLEVLAENKDPEVLSELDDVFQYGASELTQSVPSLSRLRTASRLSKEFYEQVEKNSRKSHKREPHDPLDLVDAIPNIIFPEENKDYARTLIQSLSDNPDFFRYLNKEDIAMVHAMFYSNHDDPKNREYRNIKMWDFDPSGSPVEPYGLPFVGAASLQFVMDSFVRKIRNYQPEIPDGKHPLQFIGESYFHHNIIHPFYDCNGRTNFLLMDLFLLASNLPYIKMVDDDLPEYYQTLNLPEPTQFVKFLGNLIQRE